MGIRDLLGERKGTDHAVFGGVGGAGRAGRGPHPRPLHRLVRLVLPHISLATRPGETRLESEGEEPGTGDPFRSGLVRVSLPAVSYYDWMVGDKVGEKGFIFYRSQAI